MKTIEEINEELNTLRQEELEDQEAQDYFYDIIDYDEMCEKFDELYLASQGNF